MLKKFLNSGTKLTPFFAIGLFSVLSAPAYAQNKTPEFSFHPAVSWDARNIEKDGRTICSIASEMNNGFILQFTGADQRYQTINLNFRQAIFTNEQNVDVTISVPGKITKTLPAFAAKPELIAIDTKTHQDLMSAMRKSNVIDVYIGQNAFRFYLTGLTQSASSFDQCLGLDGFDNVAAASVSAEPQREAPSPKAREGAEKAQKQYEDEMARLMGRSNAAAPAQSETTKAGTSSQDSTDTLELSQKPEAQRTRFTERLAAEMAKADGDSIDGGVKIPKASSETNTATKPANMDAPVALPQRTEADTAEALNAASLAATPVRMRAAATPVKEEIALEPLEPLDVPKTPTAIAEPVEAAPTSTITPEVTTDPAVVEAADPAIKPEELITWRSERVEPEMQEVSEKAADTTLKSDAAVPDQLPPLEETDTTAAEPAPEPVHTKIKTQEPSVTKRSAKIEADFTDAGMDHDTLPAMEVTVTPAVSPKSFDDKTMQDMHKQIEMLRAENIQLNKELEKALRASEKERLDVSTDNWNLEQATMRYNEAERQIAALGQKIQKERAQWEMEKAELEMMLFDPAVTEQAQLARLATLEAKLAEAKQELELQRAEYEERLRQMRAGMQRSAPASQ